MKNIKKVFLVAGILLAAIGCNKKPAPTVVPAAPNNNSAAQQAPAPAADAHPDWKTYSSAQYGFSFKYPAGLASITPYTGDLLTFQGNDGAFGVTVYPGVFDPKTDSKVQQGIEQ